MKKNSTAFILISEVVPGQVIWESNFIKLTFEEKERTI